MCSFRTFASSGSLECQQCDPGSAPLISEGAVLCDRCPNGIISESGNCGLGTVCEEEEYLEAGDCKECDNLVSSIILAVSFVSFISATYYGSED